MANGWWNNSGAISGVVAAYQPIGAASLAASYVNLANPGTYDAAPGTAPSFNTATGWTFNGTTEILDSGVTPANDQTWSVLVRYSGVSASGGSGSPLFGTYDSGTVRRFYYIPHYIDGNAYVANGGQDARNPGINSGVVGFRGAQPVRNGSDDGGTLSAGGAGAFGTIHIGGADDTNAPTHLYCACEIQAIVIYNATLTSGEVSTLTTLMNALPSLPPAGSKGLPVLMHYHAAVFGG